MIHIARILFGFVEFLDRIRCKEGPITLSPAEAMSRFRAIVRWGDGETQLVLGRNIGYQEASKEIGRELRMVLRSRRPDMLLCVPPALIDLSNQKQRVPAREQRIWFKTLILIRFFTKGRKFVGDAFMFRMETEFSGWKYLKIVLRESSGIIIVSSEQEDLVRLEGEAGTANIAQVLVPSRHAFSQRESVLEEIYSLLQDGGFDTVLFSAGPLSKILILELTNCTADDVRLIDTGHLFAHLRSMP